MYFRHSRHSRVSISLHHQNDKPNTMKSEIDWKWPQKALVDFGLMNCNMKIKHNICVLVLYLYIKVGNSTLSIGLTQIRKNKKKNKIKIKSFTDGERIIAHEDFWLYSCVKRGNKNYNAKKLCSLFQTLNNENADYYSSPFSIQHSPIIHFEAHKNLRYHHMSIIHSNPFDSDIGTYEQIIQAPGTRQPNPTTIQRIQKHGKNRFKLLRI